MISQEEFDSQRGVDSEPVDADMVFALDLPPEGGGAPKPSAAEKEVVDGGAKRREEEEEGGKLPARPQPEQLPKAEERRPQAKKPEKRARFYPVPNKQESQEKVGVVVGVAVGVVSVLHSLVSMQSLPVAACVTAVVEQ